MKTSSSAAFPLMIICFFTLAFNSRQLSATAAATTTDETEFISATCIKASAPYQSLCKSSLSPFASTVKKDLGILARLAIDVNRNQTDLVLSTVTTLISSFTAGGSKNLTIKGALENCSTHLESSVVKMRSSIETMQQLNGSRSATPPPAGGHKALTLEDVKGWMNAALDEEKLCDRAFDQVGDMSLKGNVLGKLLLAKQFTSNAVALISFNLLQRLGLN
ncbi:unnamed protein product [Cuscuta europaea]|uniref:Pectinesterase inhibitor domain-containing protein n=1 Tax=Cuscuta europaea TaxID=41803 RepID=A0A9P0ZXX4_CUSEU|nr:unnamed protein product [Cuscuta europaea]